jgi:membrane protease subunit HflK
MNELREQPPPPPPATPVAPAAPAPDDATSQALADALRSSFAIIKLIMIGLVIVFLGSGFFTVGTQEKAVILRFGKPVGEDESALLGPGPHWAFPYPIDEVVKIPVGAVHTVSSSFGWYATSPAAEAARQEPPPGPSLNPATDGYVLTGDGNIVHVRGTLRYRIAEPGLRYAFDFANASNLVQSAFHSALVFAAAQSSVEIARDTTAFRELAAARLNRLIAAQGLGITVDQLAVQVIPPRQLTADFARVLEAEVKRSTAINDARKYENETLSKAKAEAAGRLNAAEAERKALVEIVAAEARRFHDLLPEYRKNPRLFLDLRHTEALQRIYTNVAEKIIVQEQPDGKPMTVWLQLSREPPKPKAIELPAAHDDKH